MKGTAVFLTQRIHRRRGLHRCLYVVHTPGKNHYSCPCNHKNAFLGEADRCLRQDLLLTSSVERLPRLIAHHEEYREADKSDFALQGCSGMKFEVRGTRSHFHLVFLELKA